MQTLYLDLQTLFCFCNPHPQNANPILKNANPVFENANPKIKNKEFKDQGFVILDFPCNQFANQAPGSEDEIHEFCTLKFGTEFPRFKKIDVNGENADPLFAYLAAEKPFEGFGKGLKNAAMNRFANMNNKKYGEKAYIKWNFTKFLINGNLHYVTLRYQRLRVT